MPRPDEGLIHAWLDGELDAVEAARVEKLVADDAEWAEAAAEARGLIAASSRILGALDVVPGDVIPKGGSAAPVFGESRLPTPSVAPRRAVPTWMRIAAGVVLVAGVAYLGRGSAEIADAPERVVPMSDVVTAVGPAQPAAVPAPASATVRPPLSAPAPAPQAKKAAEQRADAAPPPQVAGGGATGGAVGVAGGVASGLVREATGAGAVADATDRNTVLARAATDSVAVQQRAEAERARARSQAQELRLESVVVTGVNAADDAARRAATSRAAAPSAPAAKSIAPTVGRVAAPMAAALVAPRLLDGCWRVATTARVDSLQASPRIVRENGDTLVLALTPAGAEAQVVREGANVLRGTVRDVSGVRATIRAEREGCVP